MRELNGSGRPRTRFEDHRDAFTRIHAARSG
jgi:hypothetical protein